MATVMADPGDIDQIIMNLAINAMDAMPDGGRIEIETSRCRIAREDLSAHPVERPMRDGGLHDPRDQG